MSNILFTGCTHFFHANILKFAPYTRQFITDVDEMNKRLVDNWNSQVSPDDTVYHLGDVSFLLGKRLEEILYSLNGNIRLILGNHDKRKYYEQTKRFESIENLVTVKINGQHVVLCHFPIYEWNGMHRGYYHLHSHVHGKLLDGMPDGRILDVGIDNRKDGDMKLYTWDEVYKYMENKPIRTH